MNISLFFREASAFRHRSFLSSLNLMYFISHTEGRPSAWPGRPSQESRGGSSSAPDIHIGRAQQDFPDPVLDRDFFIALDEPFLPPFIFMLDAYFIPVSPTSGLRTSAPW